MTDKLVFFERHVGSICALFVESLFSKSLNVKQEMSVTMSCFMEKKKNCNIVL